MIYSVSEQILVNSKSQILCGETHKLGFFGKIFCFLQVVFPAEPQLQRQRTDNSGQRAGVPGFSGTAMRTSRYAV